MKKPYTRLMVLDFETYWDKKEYTLSDMTTEEYVRDPRFKAWGMSYKWFGEKRAVWISHDNLQRFFDSVDWSTTAILCQNTAFDGSILAWHYGKVPCFYLDTLSMARAVRGVEAGNSLAKLADDMGLPPKGRAVHSTDGLTKLTFEIEQELAEYCKHDTWLCEEVYKQLRPGYPSSELRLIDMTLRMFIVPRLRLDADMLQQALGEDTRKRAELLAKLGVEEAELASSDKFAELLTTLGVDPPTKVSKKTGKTAWAFAKNDALFQPLIASENEDVALLCEARLLTKSTQSRTRAQRFVDIAQRGTLPVPLAYWGAHTGRWAAGRGEAINMQNMKRGSFLRRSIMAPPGYVVTVVDLSQIEPRVLAWLAGYEELLDIFRSGKDAYSMFGAQMFGIPGLNKDEYPVLRQSAKSALLGCGYGLGWVSFAAQLLTGFLGAPPVRYDKAFIKQMGLGRDAVEEFLNDAESVEKALKIPRTCSDADIIYHAVATKEIVTRYRTAAAPVPKFWKFLSQRIEESLVKGVSFEHKCLKFLKEKIELPNGMSLLYPDLRGTVVPNSDRKQLVYGPRKKKMYGGKLAENCLAAGTLVLTARGWVSIETVVNEDLVHDGVDFVQHGGVVFKSVQTCITVDGVLMTPDHEVLTNEGWRPASSNPKPYRPDLRGVNVRKRGRERRSETALGFSLHLWNAVRESWHRSSQRSTAGRDTKLWLHDQAAAVAKAYDARDVETSSVRRLAQHVRQVSSVIAPSVLSVRRAWNFCVRRMETFVHEFLERYAQYVPLRAYAGAREQQRGVQQSKLRVGNANGASAQSAQFTVGERSGFVGANGCPEINAVLPFETRTSAVYDIVNCGPRHRFVVLGSAGPFVVHNCVQAVARIVMTDGMLRIQERYPVLLTVHDEAVMLVPEKEAEESVSWCIEQMTMEPKYLPGIPLGAEGGFAVRYGDAKK